MDNRTRLRREYLASLAIIACLCTAPLFAGVYWLGVIAVAMYYAIVAAGLNLQLGFTGQISLASATFAMLGAYSTGILSYHWQLSALYGIPAAILATLALGLLLAATVLRLRGPYLALTTLAFGEVARNVIVASHDWTRGDIGLPIIGITDDRNTWYFIFIGVLLAVQTGLYLFLRSTAGMFLQAIRDDEIAARARGVRVVLWKSASFVIAAGLSGLAGALYAHFAKVATPELGGLYQAGVVLAMVLLGGSGSLVGPLVGALIIWLMSEVLRNVGGIQGIVFSLLVIIVARFFPRGLWGAVMRLWPQAPPPLIVRGPSKAGG